MRMIWNTDPRKITASFCVSPTPAHKISNGMNAEAGRYRQNETNGSKNASIGLNAPIAMPSGTATIAASTNPPTTRNTVMPMSRRKPNSVNRS